MSVAERDKLAQVKKVRIRQPRAVWQWGREVECTKKEKNQIIENKIKNANQKKHAISSKVGSATCQQKQGCLSNCWLEKTLVQS